MGFLSFSSQEEKGQAEDDGGGVWKLEEAPRQVGRGGGWELEGGAVGGVSGKAWDATGGTR